MRVGSSRPLVWPPIASVADAHPAVLFLQHTAMYNTDSGRRLCCSRRLFITHKRLCLKPGMPPRVLHYRPHPLLKGPPVSSTWKSEKGKQGTAVLRYSVPLHHHPPSLSHDRSIQALDLMGVDAWCLLFLWRRHIFLLCTENVFFEGSCRCGAA